MYTETLELDGVVYTVNVIGMDDGLQALNEDGGIDMAALVRLAVQINGRKPERNEIPFKHFAPLSKIVMQLNGIGGGDEGNG